MIQKTEVPKAPLAEGEIPEPRLGVFVLTEFVFCPRAGLCAHESGFEEKEELPPVSFFSFDPLYSLSEIETGIEQAMNELLWHAAGVALSAGGGLLLSLLVDPFLGLAGVLGLIWFLTFATRCGIRLHRLNEQRKEALAAQLREPDPKSEVEQKVHWWDFARAGFETQEVREALVDEALNFSGRPKRLLRRGNMVIPVWRMPHYRNELFPQNYVRLAAYCHLIRASIGNEIESPYGVILFGHGFDGVAIPFTAARSNEFLKALDEARQTIRRATAPESPTCCVKCPYGRPKRYVPDETDHVCLGKALHPCTATAPDDKRFHSLCGDRFRWLPPHAATKELELELHR